MGKGRGREWKARGKGEKEGKWEVIEKRIGREGGGLGKNEGIRNG